jgi:tetratricopeptide (TPR) repeat protein
MQNEPHSPTRLVDYSPEFFDQARNLRLLAAQLHQRGTSAMNEAALALLDRLIRDCPEPRHLAAAHAERAACLRMLGRYDDAIGAYHSAFDAERRFRQVHCLAYLEFAEFALTVGQADLFREALAAIEEFWPEDDFPIEHCRAEIAQALLYEGLGEHEPARRNAQRALATLARTRSRLGKRGAALTTEADLALQVRLSRLGIRKRH